MCARGGRRGGCGAWELRLSPFLFAADRLIIRMMRRMLLMTVWVAGTSLLPGLASAQGTKLWSVSRYDEMEKGSTEGVAIRSDGRLEAGPANSLLYATGKSYVWSMGSDAAGDGYLGLGGAASGAAAVRKVAAEGEGSQVFSG